MSQAMTLKEKIWEAIINFQFLEEMTKQALHKYEQLIRLRLDGSVNWPDSREKIENLALGPAVIRYASYSGDDDFKQKGLALCKPRNELAHVLAMRVDFGHPLDPELIKDVERVYLESLKADTLAFKAIEKSSKLDGEPGMDEEFKKMKGWT
jgi:hypothetical protein